MNSKEIEITKRARLLDEKGNIQTPGYAKQMLFDYKRTDIKANPFALKEWDFYQFQLGSDYVVQLTIGHLSYVANFSVNLFSLKEDERKTFDIMKLFPFQSLGLPTDPEVEQVITQAGKNYAFSFKVTPEKRIIRVKALGKDGDIDIRLELPRIKDYDKMVIAIPFPEKGRFYLNYKEHFYGVSGHVKMYGKTFVCDSTTTGVLDWGRGVWPFKNEWYWGSGAVVLPTGDHFGFNIGWGFGDVSNATENMFFWNGQMHKIAELKVSRDETNYLAPWHFVDPKGSMSLTMTPVFDNHNKRDMKLIQTECHQVFGLFNGFIVLEDGTKKEIQNMLAFCEACQNKW